MAITAQQVNDLRQRTGAGMMDCKKALTEADGDFEKAIEILRKKGAAVAAKRASKDANEGLVVTKLSADGSTGTMVEVNCETDFVAKSDDFVNFANLVLETAFASGANSVDSLLASHPELNDKLTEVVGKVGEKTTISRVGKLAAESGIVVDYIHPGSKLAVMVQVNGLAADKKVEFEPIAKDIAMQVAAMRPLGVTSADIPSDVVEKEIDIYKELARKEGKPEAILEKIAQGKLAKFYQENCLTEQAYIKDNSVSVKELVENFNKKTGATASVVAFLRFQLTDEKK